MSTARRIPRGDLELGLEVLRWTVHGYDSDSVGRRLGRSADSVKSRLGKLYAILGARSAAHAVAIALAEGLLTPDDVTAAVGNRRPGWAAPASRWAA